jgi:hypothetical protein
MLTRAMSERRTLRAFRVIHDDPPWSIVMEAPVPHSPMSRAIAAGTVYFVAVFLVGFVLGILRVLVVAPRLGAVAAVLIEAPAILAASWVASRECVRRFGVGRSPGLRLAMGGSAFALLMAVEAALAVLAFGLSLADHLAAYLTVAGALGLAAQLGFAVIPLIQVRRRV